MGIARYIDLRLGGPLGERLLQAICRRPEDEAKTFQVERDTTTLTNKLEQHFGLAAIKESFADRVVLDFGCGTGREAVSAALHHGAARVIGIDSNELYIAECRERAAHHGVADKCLFLHSEHDRDEIERLSGNVDLVYSLDSFEHFADPADVLSQMERFLAPGGMILISFGPLWWHPRGSHMDFFCPLPWLQVFFREETILRVRGHYRNDGLKSWSEAGLNQMTLARFKRLIRDSPLEALSLEAVPIRHCGPLAKLSLFREFLTSVVRCRLRKGRESANSKLRKADMSKSNADCNVEDAIQPLTQN